jgi:hypothetical protein
MLKNFKRRAAPAMLVLCMGLAACNLSQWRVSGEVLDAVGQQFLATGKMYDQLFEQGSLTPAEYRPWAVFAERFKLVYEPAVKAWLAAASTQEKGDAADAILAVKNELLTFYIAALSKKEGGG